MRINKQDFWEIQSHIDLAKSRLDELGLTLHADHDAR